MESTVIYVSFGGAAPREPAPRRDPVRKRSGLRIVRGTHGLMDLYSTSQVSRLLGIPEGRLRWWRRCGLVTPGGRQGSRRLYTFRDLVSLRAARDLTACGLRASRIMRAVQRLSSDLGEMSDPLVKMRVRGNDRRLVVDDGEGAELEAETGQVLIDFRVEHLAEEASRTLAFDPSGRGKATGDKSAYEWFLEGVELEEESPDEAEQAYAKALELDPQIAAASTNLGNLLFRRERLREAEDLYRQAIQADPEQPQAYYNLGFLKLESGRPDLSIVFLQKALSLDPHFSDARFNLAVAFEREGRAGEARREFRRFLEMDPSSPWSRVARLHLERMDGGSV